MSARLKAIARKAAVKDAIRVAMSEGSAREDIQPLYDEYQRLKATIEAPLPVVIDDVGRTGPTAASAVMLLSPEPAAPPATHGSDDRLLARKTELKAAIKAAMARKAPHEETAVLYAEYQEVKAQLAGEEAGMSSPPPPPKRVPDDVVAVSIGKSLPVVESPTTPRSWARGMPPLQRARLESVHNMETAPQPMRIRDGDDGSLIVVAGASQFECLPSETLGEVFQHNLIVASEPQAVDGAPLALSVTMGEFREAGMAIRLDSEVFVLDFASRSAPQLDPLANAGTAVRLAYRDDGALSVVGDLAAAPAFVVVLNESGQACTHVIIGGEGFPVSPGETVATWAAATEVPVKAIFSSTLGETLPFTVSLHTFATLAVAIAINNIVYRVVAKDAHGEPWSATPRAMQRAGHRRTRSATVEEALPELDERQIPLRPVEAHCRIRWPRVKKRLMQRTWATEQAFVRLLPFKNLFLVYPDHGSMFAKQSHRVPDLEPLLPSSYAETDGASWPRLGGLSDHDMSRALVLRRTRRDATGEHPALLVLILNSAQERDSWLTQLRRTRMASAKTRSSVTLPPALSLESLHERTGEVLSKM